MLCVEVNAAGQLVPVDPQPVDVSSCSYVVATAAESLPFVYSGTAAGEFFAFGFAVVVATYWCSYGVGQVLAAVRRRR